MILREHAGTLLFASDSACRNFVADTGVDFHGSFFAFFFFTYFFVGWGRKNYKNKEKTGSEPKWACGGRFGGLGRDFWTILDTLETILGNLGEAWGDIWDHSWPCKVCTKFWPNSGGMSGEPRRSLGGMREAPQA